MGRPAEAERWADVVDRWQYQGAARSGDPFIEAVAALNRALLGRRGVTQMRADADEAASKFAAAGAVIPVVRVVQGARTLMREIDGLVNRRPGLGTLVVRPTGSERGCRRTVHRLFPERRH
jgi:hypothetical protein